MISIRHPRTFHGLIACLFLAAAALRANEPAVSPGNTNAALQYWQAFSQLPAMDEHRQQIVANWNTVPVDADAVKLIEASSTALTYLHRGSALESCDWGLQKEDGIMLLMPHLAKARELARLALLRAREELDTQNSAAAADDIADVLVLANFVGSDTFAIGLLVQDSIEQMAFDLAASRLGQFAPESLRTLADRLGKLPHGGTLQSALRNERQFSLEWMIARLRNANDQSWQEALRPLAIETPKGTFEAIVEELKTKAGAVQEFEEFRPFYDELTTLAERPPDVFRSRAADLLKKYQNDAVGRLMLSDFVRVFDKDLATRTRFSLLKAAVAVLLSGPGELRNFPDPAGTGPFEYAASERGFELRSKLTIDGRPVVLAVGKPRR